VPRREAFWTCGQGAGIEPPTHAAARAIRPGGRWRTGSVGTQSAAGSRLVASSMTVGAPLQPQPRHGVSSLPRACAARSGVQRLPLGSPPMLSKRQLRRESCFHYLNGYHGASMINSADLERLHATGRARLAALPRRGGARARHTLTLQPGMSRSGTVAHCGPPHTSLAHAGGTTTPALAAGSTAHGWRVHALLLSRVPPPQWTPPKHRGRPSHAMKRLMARWCGDHG